MIKPQTIECGISYIQLLENSKEKACIGKATHFASHAWAYLFISFTAAIFRKCEEDALDEDRTILWIDIFSVNQHSGISHFDHWANRFRTAIRIIGRALKVLMPYRRAIWMERAWCIFELWAIAEGSVPFEIVLTLEEYKSFIEYLIGGGKIEDLMGDIDIRKARAHNESDVQNINKIVDESIGHGRLNELVSSEMSKWFTVCIVC